MNDRTAPPIPRDDWTRAGGLFAGALFALAAVLVTLALRRQGGPLPEGQWLPALFFFGYGLFTISVGYRGPNQHYYSFDRISQVASILVLGPVEAAWINGLASLLYPLHRLRQGVGMRRVLLAAMANSGTMALSILGAGLLYTRIGGEVPLMAVGGLMVVVALLVLVLAMQVLNDAAMLALSVLSLWAWRRGRLYDTPWLLNGWRLMAPSGFIAVLAGWFVVEIGRQPWVVQGLLRTEDAVSDLEVSSVVISLSAFVLAYAIVFGAGGGYIYKLLRRGPMPFEPAPETEDGDRTPRRPLSAADGADEGDVSPPEPGGRAN